MDKESKTGDPKEEQRRIVRGTITRTDGAKVSDAIVRAFDETISETFLGEAKTDADGSYLIEYITNPSGSTSSNPNLIIGAFDDKENLRGHSDVRPDAGPDEIINFEISMKTAASRTETGMTYTVEGRVSSPDSPAVGGLRVRIVDKNVGSDVQMAETLTDERGDYSVSFVVSSLAERCKQKPDLQARVYSEQTFLAASVVRYYASTHEVLSVRLPAGAALPSEYESLVEVLAAHCSGTLADLHENDERQDITYLANKTGWDARAVALASLADQFSRRASDHSIPAVLFYALFRAGLPANENTLYQLDKKTVTTVWNKAAEQNVIPKSAIGMIPAASDQFQKLSAQKLLSAPALAGTSSLTEMLTASQLDNEQQTKFAALYAEHRTDMTGLWKAVTQEFGSETSEQLQIDGKLGFLTINNAPLTQALHNLNGRISDPLQLAQTGYHKASQWAKLLTSSIPIPKGIPGENPDVKRANYADYLAAQVRLSYPTASVAHMVKSGDLTLPGASQGVVDQVHSFLDEHDGKFEIGLQPVQQYMTRNKVQVGFDAVQQIMKLQRVYQITPSDQAMTALLNHGIDSAYKIVKFEKKDFIRNFETDLGGPETAALIYDKSTQVHNAVLNIAISYLTAKNGIGLGIGPLNSAQQNLNGPGLLIQPAPQGAAADNAGDVIAYPTLEGLFGEMDFCACDHCRSVLSPAAYLVDLLQFIDQPSPPAGTENPQAVLFSRRPDIQHLPLTCENTNTALPYIDVVNETLEYYIANGVQALTLNGFVGHDTGDAESADLLASPQFVMDSAYATLKSEYFPSPLPFHQPLENLRPYFEKFEVPLPLAMERFRKNDALERGANPYGWRDILMEELRLSRAEHEILTDSGVVPLWRLYGFPNGTSNAAVIAALSNAKQFSRRVAITYEDIAAILRTQFVNPNSGLIPKLEKLGVPISTLKALKDGTITNAAFDALLPTGASAPDAAAYGGDIKAWVKNDANQARIMSLITLTDPTGNPDPCNFDTLEFRFAKPMANSADTSTRLGAVEFYRLLRFLRVWKKIGWTIEQTDAAICALYRTDLGPFAASDVDSLAKLDQGFRDLLPRLGIVVRVMKALNTTPKRDLLSLLAYWSDIGTHGERALYRQMFLNAALLKQDAAFADNGFGDFLVDGAKNVAQHAEALRSAFNLTGDQYDSIVTALGYDANTPLSVHNISAIYRRGHLARKLKLSVRELLLLTSLTGLDPFAAPDPTNPAILRLIVLVQDLKARSLKSAVALYLIWNQDLSGKSAPAAAGLTEFARTLRGDFAAIEDQFAAIEDPGGDIVRARMTQVYGPETTDSFFALLDNTLILDVAYTHGASTLEAAIMVAGPGLSYDDFKHRVSHSGLLMVAVQTALTSIAGVSQDFIDAVNALFARGEDSKGAFFARNPELKPHYDNTVALDLSLVLEVDYTHSAATLEPSITAADSRIAYDNTLHKLSYSGILKAAKRDKLKSVPNVEPLFQETIDALFAQSQEAKSAVFAALQPELSRRRKRQQALQRLSAAAGIDLASTQALLDPPSNNYPLHAAGHLDESALNDVLALETPGLAVEFFFEDTATDPVGLSVPAASNLDYAAAGSNPLPANPAAGEAISGIWNGQVETPEAGFYNFIIEADAGATVALNLDGQARPLTKNGNLYRNSQSLELKGGTLYDIEVKVEKVKDKLSIKWETPKRAREVIPSRYLYPPTIFAPFTDAYVRFLKTASLAAGIDLTANEIAHFATHPDYHIAGDGWLNALPASGDPSGPVAAALLKPLRDLLDYSRIKAEISPEDETLLTVIKEPAEATATADSALFAITQWDSVSLGDLLAHFGNNIAGLTHFDLFRRVYDAFSLIKKMGILPVSLITATTNEPISETVRGFQAALRARYDNASWRDVIQPINDTMRALQRDALVRYVLHRMLADPATEHINTADKLFEYFLMDVQMEPCMQTSRIRHALSSVQLFIERCLMNLEPRVSPESVIAKQWGWMNRYRVWEANRKVFLFPENWADPELRDDQSPFFKEAMSELLQGDITEEKAAIALLNYLSKLEEVAKLEPCGIHYVENDPGADDDIAHVVARTVGASRKYFYRRREFGYWTPWEQIKLDIEDNPVLPVIWNNRLFLFWLRIIKQSPLDPGEMRTSSTTTNDIGDLKMSEVKGDAKESAKNSKLTVQAVLCWSEFFNGKWQATRTSNPDRPLCLGQFDSIGASAFDRSKLLLSVFFWTKGTIRIIVSSDIGAGNSFFLYNAFSSPELRTEKKKNRHFQPKRIMETSASSLKITYPFANANHPVLTNEVTDQAIDPHHPVSGNPWDVPFFYEDSRHVFYVNTSQQMVRVPEWHQYGFVESSPVLEYEIPPLVQQVPKSIDPMGPITKQAGFGVINSSAMQFIISEDAYIQRGLGTLGTVNFDEKEIGPAGSVAVAIQKR